MNEHPAQRIKQAQAKKYFCAILTSVSFSFQK